MNNYIVLFMGEMQRHIKYHILSASLFVAALWIGVLFFSDIEDVTGLSPLLVFIDITSMAILTVGVSMFFEKQEGVIKTMFVTPITKIEYIMSKNISSVVVNVIGMVVLYLYANYFRELNINFWGFLGGILLITYFHSLLGFVLTYSSKDFTDLLMGSFKYILIFMVPVMLDHIGLITNNILQGVMYLLPTKAAMTLILSSAGGVENWEIWYGIGYMLFGSLVLQYAVNKKFQEFAAKESGV